MLYPHRSVEQQRGWGTSDVKRQDESTFSAAYIRVSSASQDYQGQRVAIEQAARGRGERVDRWFADVGSGKSLRRPELERLRREIEARHVRRLWVWRLDRLTRSGIVDMISVVRGIQASGCELISLTDGIPLEGPASDPVLAIIAWCAQLQREQIAENQAAARARMQSEGRSWGRPPLPPHVVDRVRALRSQEKTQRQIARELHISKSSVQRYLEETDH